MFSTMISSDSKFPFPLETLSPLCGTQSSFGLSIGGPYDPHSAFFSFSTHRVDSKVNRRHGNLLYEYTDHSFTFALLPRPVEAPPPPFLYFFPKIPHIYLKGTFPAAPATSQAVKIPVVLAELPVAVCFLFLSISGGQGSKLWPSVASLVLSEYTFFCSPSLTPFIYLCQEKFDGFVPGIPPWECVKVVK